MNKKKFIKAMALSTIAIKELNEIYFIAKITVQNPSNIFPMKIPKNQFQTNRKKTFSMNL